MLMVLQEFLWSKIAQCLVRADGIIHILPLQQSLIQFRYIEVGICYFIELLCMCPLGPFHMAIEFG